MRDYLIGFFKDFDYASDDAAFLLDAYDKTVAIKKAHDILGEALDAYRKSPALDYPKEILNRAKAISAITGLHPYTTDLLVFICMTKQLKVYYKEKGLEASIYRDSVLDLKWKLEECKLVKGIIGSFVAPWFDGFFNLTRFALGRLQFEITHIHTDYEKNGVVLKKDVSRVIGVHIPRTGTPMDKESCDKSYAMAREFFRDEVGESAPFVCHSWLLYPVHREILPTNTNTYRFLSEYDIVESGVNGGHDLWRLFDTDERDPDKLPTNGSLRRAYVDYLKKGGRPGWGFGVKL